MAMAQAPGAGGSLRLEANTNGFELVIDPILTPGQLSVHQSGALRTLGSNPEIMLQTNTPFPQALRVPLLSVGRPATQAFFQTVLRPEAAVLIAATNIPRSGGRIVAPANGPLAGLVLEVPANAYPEARKFTLSYTPLGDRRFSEFATPITPLINVDNGGAAAQELMSLTLPMTLATNEIVLGSLLRPETGAREYVPLAISTNGTVTLFTRHFSGALFEKTTISALQKLAPLQTDFRPGTDDWDFGNYGTFVETRGQCYAMAASAIWYFQNQRSAAGPLFTHFDRIPQGFSTPKVPQDNVRGERFVGLLQRESMNLSYPHQDQVHALYTRRNSARGSSQTFSACCLELRRTRQPQLIVFPHHAVVAFAADADSIYVADPNIPGQPQAIHLNWYGDTVYQNSQGTKCDSPLLIVDSLVMNEPLLPQLWQQVEAGTIGQEDFPSFKIAVVEKQAGVWTEIGAPTMAPTDVINSVIQAHSDRVVISLKTLGGPPAYNLDWKVMDTNGTVLDTLDIPLAAGNNVFGVRALAAPEATGVNSTSAWAGFTWITVQTAPPPVSKATFAIRSFAGTGWEGVATPATIVATVTKPGQTTFAGSNRKTERGNPPFSLSIPASKDLRFYECGTVTGFPTKPGGPSANRPGASSFIAVAGGDTWIDASAGAYRINGSTGLELDWEYQLRYVSKDPSTGKPKLKIGTLTNIDAWAGFEIPEENYSVQLE